jgi:fructose-1,6-bisphosphatase/inositol monophosphatase family enzyme
MTELSRIMDQAARIALDSRQHLQIELKRDVSIVTNADRNVETFLRNELRGQWPGSKFWGEEFGREDPSGDEYWLIDPVDGTSNFAFGSPLWGISLGLVKDGVIEAGLVWLPDLNEQFSAERGGGAFRNGAPLASIPTGAIERHQLVSYCESVLSRYPLQPLPGKMRCAGAFVIDGTFVATQRYRGMIGLNERIYDAAASMLICEELGAEIRWADGSEMDLAPLIGGEQFEKGWLIFPADSGFRLTEPG